MEYSVAFVGNPNVGKTSLYNRITKSFEHVGNWHGVTVSKVSKTVKIEGKTVTFADLPGLYSFTIYSPEEGISRDSVYFGNNDLNICVCDANNLARNMYLALQLIEIGAPAVLAVNMSDELKKTGKTIDIPLLSQRLGIPVVEVSAKRKSGADALVEQVNKFLNGKYEKKQADCEYLSALPVHLLANTIAANSKNSGLPSLFAAVKVLENDSFIIDKLKLNEKQKKLFSGVEDSQALIAKLRFEYIDKVLDGVITYTKNPDKPRAQSGEGIIDKIVLNKYFAFPIFLLIMGVIFFITFGLVGNWLSYLMELGIDKLIYSPLHNFLIKVECPVWITELLCEGIIMGVGGILTFLPQIVLLFFFLALLEDSGYLSRVAFMTDGMFRKIGLSGRSSFTMLMGFGCSATAVLTSRGLEDENMRKKTILLTPFYSCSARLPVYSVIAAAYFTGGQAMIIFGMYILGIIVSLLLAFILEKCVKSLKSGKQSFIMEMPPYRLPTFERVWQLILNNVKVFIIRVGTVIFALNVIVWVLSNFSFIHGFVPGTSYKSIFEVIGGFLAPVFRPLGFGNWKAVTSLLSGIVAKEIVISSIESLGGVSSIFSGDYASAAALAFMTFTLLYVPCVATLVAIKKETGWKWMLLSLILQLSVAYVFALAVYWAARLFAYNFGLALGLIIIIPVALIVVYAIYRMIKNRRSCPYGCSSCDSCDKNAKKK